MSNSFSEHTVSVVMATYNRAGQLTDTISNIFEQNYNKIELIIVNDGSVDETRMTLLRLGEVYDFIVIHNPINLGLQKSLNLGIKKASGKYIARIDDHDRWIDKTKLSKQVAHLELNPDVGVLGTGYQFGSSNMLNPISDSEIRKQILMRSPFCHVSVVMRKSVVVLVGVYDERLEYSEDWDLWLKIGIVSQLANLSDITVAIEQDDISLSQDFYLKQMPINRRIVQKYYKKYPSSLKAFLYHEFLRFFFAIFPLNGRLHRVMKHVFLNYFALSSNKKNVNEPIV